LPEVWRAERRIATVRCFWLSGTPAATGSGVGPVEFLGSDADQRAEFLFLVVRPRPGSTGSVPRGGFGAQMTRHDRLRAIAI